MKSVLVTGARGFIGKNLVLALSRQKDIKVISHDIGDDAEILHEALKKADIIYHLAGVNRPKETGEFDTGNRGFTDEIIRILEKEGRAPIFVASSSTQAELDNPYGKSKYDAELILQRYREHSRAKVFIYRLTNVFGKWCKPFYNSVVATFCHQAAHNEPYRIDDPDKAVDFIYIDDIVQDFLQYCNTDVIDNTLPLYSIAKSYRLSIGELAEKLDFFKRVRTTCLLPDFSDPLEKYLYSTYLSYLETGDFMYGAEKKTDARGYLFELIKSKSAGQIFVSRTIPGITRGNHYHDTKVEKFCVVEGSGLISFRHMITGETFSVEAAGVDCKIVDIPPGYTHSIKNVGQNDLITIFWANEIFDQTRPDTYFCEV